jgi:glutamyl-tRNA reductase
VVVGLSHRTAPVELRERVAFAEPLLDGAVRRAADLAGGEAMLVSTCNRVELYLAAASPDEVSLRGVVGGFFAEGHDLDGAAIDPHLYVHAGEAAVRHLFRVASSLDSVVVGEPQILGQVKGAWEAAGRAGTVGQVLGQVVPRAFAVAKRVRSETEVARASASVASAAVDLGRRIFGDLAGRDVLVVGAGKMGALAAKHLVAAGGRLLVVNRTFARGEELVRELEVGEAHRWEDLPQLLVRADIVLCSTGASQPVIGRDLIVRTMRARKGRWLCLLDIAVPRDVEPAVGDVENVYLYDVDALSRVVDDHLAGRRREADAAELIVAEEVERYRASRSARGVVPTIRALREHFTGIARAEVERALGRMPAATEKDRGEVQALADAIVNKLLHLPLTALKRDAESETLLVAVRRLFELEQHEGAKHATADGEKRAAAGRGDGG